MMFFLFFLFFTIIGFMFFIKKLKTISIAIILICISLIPSGSIFQDYIMKYSFYAFIGIPLGITIAIVVNTFSQFKINRDYLYSLILFFLVVVICLFNFNIGMNLVRDLRAYILFFISFTASYYIKSYVNISTANDKEYLKKIINISIYIAFFKSLTLLVFIRITGMTGSSPNEPYDQRLNQWYGDLSLFVGVAWLVCANSKSIYLDIMAFTPIVISGNRTMTVVVLFIYLIKRKISIKNILKYTAVSLFVSLFIYERFLVTPEALIGSLYSRFSPFFESFSKVTTSKIIFGNGIGYGFEIPWFINRDLNTLINCFDNYYLTQFAKFGLLSIPITLIIVFALSKVISCEKNKFYFYFGLMGLTTSLLYQSSFPFVILIFSIISSVYSYPTISNNVHEC